MNSLEQAEAFFYEHAGYAYDPRTETPEQGRTRGAIRLAEAEARLIAGPYFVDTTPDPFPWDGDEPYDGPLWIVSLYRVDDRTEPECIGSIGGVACEAGDAYLRVVAAELAAEHIEPRVRLPYPPFPRHFTQEPGQCSLNASELEGWEGTRYAEGWARGPGEEWTQHAWLVHPAGYVIDPTWSDADEHFEYREDADAWQRED